VRYWLTGAAYITGFIAAMLIAFFPPQGRRYTWRGRPIVEWEASDERTWQGWLLPWLGPLLLAVSFGLQLFVWWRYG
jgi:hypothetical protein